MTIQGIKQRFSIIGRSEKLDRAILTAMRVAKTDLSVLIQGESGAGKEIFSKILHELSKRKHNKFIAINCGAIPEGTINSELFGHEKGAFTGATSEREGYFETVNGGTIFLDEIGEMPLDTQAYLLRVLESGEIIKVGSSSTMKTDVRVIAATNVDLQERIKTGKFREDLYYRLNTISIQIPSLHERREDIYMLFRRFAIDFSEKYNSEAISLDDRAKLIIENYSWPGNVRELKNVVEQLSVLSDKAEISAEDLLEVCPYLLNRNLPAINKQQSSTLNSSDLQEREILYKFLFDMKSDLNDLKSLVYGLIHDNDLNVDRNSKFNTESKNNNPEYLRETATNDNDSRSSLYEYQNDKTPIILNSYESTEEVEESLSLENMEKELISKALKKYRGRRKDAAEELGISERTLYRKIKHYEINE